MFWIKYKRSLFPFSYMWWLLIYFLVLIQNELRVICDWLNVLVCPCLFSGPLRPYLLAHLWRHFLQALVPLIGHWWHWFLPYWKVFCLKITPSVCLFLKGVSAPYVMVEPCFFLKGWLTHSHTMTPFDAPGKQAFWKHCGKRRNCS